tara:strand:+ start:136 stop:507 length:372 start_codon:yes stop_codon:yes gene_type:complete
MGTFYPWLQTIEITYILAVIIVLITEWGIVSTHVWAREDHTHWSHKPFSRFAGLGVANYFHIASFCSHWPMQMYIHYYFLPPIVWPLTIILSSLIWNRVKKGNNKKWDVWFIQIYKWVKKNGY